MRRGRGLLPVLFAAALVFGSVAAHAEKRLALVIGIDAYQSLPKLQKAVNDARAMAAVLHELGFTVIAAENPTRREMSRKLADLEARIAAGDMVFFFFAGHGVALGNTNYLIAADMPKPGDGEESVVRDEAFAADDLVRRLQGRGARVAFLVLDACRNNPFEQSGVRAIGGTRGLAIPQTHRGVFVLFSAGIGQLALDRLGDRDLEPNSVFTRKLLPLLRAPGLSHVDLAKRVQEDVDALAATIGHPQQPAYYDQIVGSVVLKAGKSAQKAPESPPVPAPTAVRLSEAAEAWPEVKTTNSTFALESYIRRFGDTFYGDLAKARLAELKQVEAEAERRRLAALKVEDDRQRAAAEAKRKADEEARRVPAPGRIFRDCEECPVMVVVPAGSFIMGSNDHDVEKPPHRVAIRQPFAVAKFEVTFAEWEACVKGGGCASNRSPSDQGWGRGQRPVIDVSWSHAKEYAAWLSAKTGKTYRLLSEAEWEYAARAGTTTKYAFGDTISTRQAQFSAEQTVEVGKFDPNAWGLYDMHGNVLEWCEDNWYPNYQGAPSDGSVWPGGDTSLRVVRGGSWNFVIPDFLRSANRLGYLSGFRFTLVGFRLARTL
ncbi:MAG: SUMF1/EgtB/PvdO family nonheme iron enzyme [Hyphomicrobiaceae bacterium]